MSEEADCQHRWVASTTSGIPQFVRNRHFWIGYRAAVRCENCEARTWVNRAEWNANRAEGTPERVKYR